MTERWTPERIAEYREMTQSEDVLSMLAEIERLQAAVAYRDEVIEQRNAMLIAEQARASDRGLG